MFLISVLAAICSTTASVPQLLGKTDHLSNFTMFIRCLGAFLWAVYGFIQIEYALIVSSSIAGLVELCLIFKTNCVRGDSTVTNDIEHCPTDVRDSDISPVEHEMHE